MKLNFLGLFYLCFSLSINKIFYSLSYILGPLSYNLTILKVSFGCLTLIFNLFNEDS